MRKEKSVGKAKLYEGMGKHQVEACIKSPAQLVYIIRIQDDRIVGKAAAFAAALTFGASYPDHISRTVTPSVRYFVYVYVSYHVLTPLYVSIA